MTDRSLLVGCRSRIVVIRGGKSLTSLSHFDEHRDERLVYDTAGRRDLA